MATLVHTELIEKTANDSLDFPGRPSLTKVASRLSLGKSIQDSRARFPSRRLDCLVSELEGAFFGDCIDNTLRSFNFTHSHPNPGIFKDVGYLIKQIEDLPEARREEMVNSALDRSQIARVVVV